MSKSEKIQSKSVKIDDESKLNMVFLYKPYKKYLQASLKNNDPEIDKKNYAKYVLSYIDKIGEKEQFATADLKGSLMLQSTVYEQDLLDKIENLMKQQDNIKKIIQKNYIASHKIQFRHCRRKGRCLCRANRQKRFHSLECRDG